VVEALLASGFRVRVLSRDPAKAKTLLPSSVEHFAGDAADANAVDEAVRGVQGVHISVSGPADRTSAENVVSVAPQREVQRITYLSGSTVAQENAWFPMTAGKLAAEQALVGCPVPSTIFRPTWPMEQLPRFVREGQATVIGEQPTPLHWYAASDLARMVSAAFQREEAANTCLFVHGPEALTMREALERFCRAEHPEVEVTTLPMETARAAAKASGDPVMNFMTEMMAYFDQAGELGDSSEADALLGPNTVTLDQWLEARDGGSRG